MKQVPIIINVPGVPVEFHSEGVPVVQGLNWDPVNAS
jgi:hypothetical protein